MPYITEELWQWFPKNNCMPISICLTRMPNKIPEYIQYSNILENEKLAKETMNIINKKTKSLAILRKQYSELDTSTRVIKLENKIKLENNINKLEKEILELNNLLK